MGRKKRVSPRSVAKNGLSNPDTEATDFWARAVLLPEEKKRVVLHLRENVLPVIKEGRDSGFCSGLDG